MASKTELSIILKAIDAASGVFSKVDKSVGKLGKKATAVGKKMTIGLTAPFVAMAGASLKAASTFEKGMSDVSTLIDTNVESMDEMRAKVLAMSTAADQAAVPLEDMTGALFDIRSAGIGASEAMTVLSQSAKLGVAGLGTTKQAADLGTSAINAFSLSSDDAAQVFGTFLTATKFGKTTIAALSQGFGATAKTVAANNIELDEFLAITAALTTSGLSASEAFTGQRAILSGLTRVTKDTSAVYNKLGVKDLPEAIKKFGGFQGAINEVSGAVDGNQGKLQKLLGSNVALNAVLAITSEQGKTATDALREMRSGADNLGEAFSKQNKTMAAGMQRTKNSINAAAISLGTVLAPVASKVAGIITTVANAFTALDDDTKEVIVTIAAVAAVMGPVLFIGGKLVSMFVLLKGVIVGGAAAMRVLSTAAVSATGAMTGSSVAAGALTKAGRFAKFAGGLTAAATAGWALGRALDNALGLQEKLLGTGAPTDIRELAKDLGFSRRAREGLGALTAGEIAVDRRKAADIASGLSSEQLEERRVRALELSRATGAARAVELAQGTPGAGGDGGTVEVKFSGVPRGVSVEQTAGDPIDLEVGRQLTSP